ncbi:FadR/GntR family transcriptional regulator [Mucilaginibacter terrae]|uniref:DNA-binding FadR family transcriptional regulator n=1 Tax=Mucilaginibacter terrae TaxID=1955052 RepID=A0ABU3GSW9_9SPHI|nr:FadR/GntR family transcriptional regulator [Mucilaginibacter terrae]MDT3402656.1 DNA-binding FadR family transcriptional regulator [Mucilaginibacter terrae]
MDARIKLSDRISRLIKHDIEKGKYQPGDKIPPEPELMKLYEVGRSTIREAVKALAMAGVVRVQQGMGTIVNATTDAEPIDSKLRRADFDEVNAVRRMLDREIVSLAVENHTTEHIQEMELHLQNRKAAIERNNRQACMDADIAFHATIAQASGNSVLFNLYQSFTTVILDFFSKREPQGIASFAMSHYLHEQLFNAIKGKKLKQAREAMQQILDNNY